MAEWGIAMSRWGNPFGAAQRAAKPLEEGAAAVARGKALAPKTPREQAYLDAVGALFANVATVDQRTRFVAYRDAMATLAAANPTDPEAQIFYALSVAGSHAPSDKSYAQLLKAGAILEGLIAKYPQHPGLSHYIIHSYDVPALADRGLAAARRYAKIAPSAPHALHMPSHTFTRVGSWQESIDTNVASAESARKLGSTAEELHAMDYQAYAALQTGQDVGARRRWSAPCRRSRRASIRTRSAARRPVPPAPTRSPRFRRATPSSAATGRRRRRWRPSRARSSSRTRRRGSPRRWAPRAAVTPPAPRRRSPSSRGSARR